MKTLPLHFKGDVEEGKTEVFGTLMYSHGDKWRVEYVDSDGYTCITMYKGEPLYAEGDTVEEAEAKLLELLNR